MKLLLDDKQHRGCNLNANEACIFAAILKCTRAGRGWYGNYRELAAAMPFVMSYKTASRAVQKLLNLGLIEIREEKLFSVGQIVPTDGQNVPANGQNVPEDGQNVLPPNNPPINNNMNEKEKEQPRALRTHDGNEQQGSNVKSFAEFKNLYLSTRCIIPLDFERREASLMVLWKECSEMKRQEILQKLEAFNHGVDFNGWKPNPIFFLQDYPEPKPTFLRGDEAGDLVQVRYNGAYKICTRETMELFHLEFVRDW